MIGLAIWFEQMGGRDRDQPEGRFNLSYQRFAAAIIVAVRNDCAIQPDPAGRNVNVVAVANGQVGLKAHPFGPVIPNGCPFQIGQLAIFYGHGNGHVHGVFRKRGAQFLERRKLPLCRRAIKSERAANNRNLWPQPTLVVFCAQKVI